MQQRSFGPNGLTNSPFCFGTMQFGGRSDEAASNAMYAACREAGINFFDTAHDYNGGRSEEILGKLVAPERDKIILATKVAASGGSSPENIHAQFQESLRRLALDHVDILFLHRWDEGTPLEKSLEACAELHRHGLFTHLGVSNWSAWQVMKGQAIAAREGFPRIDILQPMYNLVKRQVEVEILPMALSEDIAVVGYSPLGGGLLTGKYADNRGEGRLAEDEMYEGRYGPDWMHQAAADFAAFAKARDVHPATLAVAWAARHPGHTCPIISAKSTEQLAPSLAALDFTMDDTLYEEISAMSPTPPPATDRLEEQS